MCRINPNCLPPHKNKNIDINCTLHIITSILNEQPAILYYFPCIQTSYVVYIQISRRFIDHGITTVKHCQPASWTKRYIRHAVREPFFLHPRAISTSGRSTASNSLQLPRNPAVYPGIRRNKTGIDSTGPLIRRR